MRAKLRTAALVLACALALAFGLIEWRASLYERPGPDTRAYARNFVQIGYSDLGGRPGFKMAMQQVNGRWYLYVAHLWAGGWSVLDVTDPASPKILRFIPAPAGTQTSNIQVSHGLMLTSLEAPSTELGRYLGFDGFAWLAAEAIAGRGRVHPGTKFREGVLIWDVRDPANPRLIGQWHGGGIGTHRNFYNGGRYAWLAASKPGIKGQELVVIDLSDPKRPREIGNWHAAEQEEGSGRHPPEGYFMHGPAQISGNRAYVSYGISGAILLDTSDPARPRELGRVNPYPEWGSLQGVHTLMPLGTRKLAVINGEAHDEECRRVPGKNYAAMVDLADETHPRIVSFFPEPIAPAGASYTDFCRRGGRTGPHNQAHDNGEPHFFESDHLTFLASFNSGLRLYETSDPLHVRELGYFLPPDPRKRYGVFPTRLVAQTEDVVVDRRGYAYISDKNQGIYIVRSTSPEFLAELARQK